MTSHETAIAERLHDAANRIPVDTDVVPDLTRIASRSSPRRRVVIAGVAAAVATWLWSASSTRPAQVDAAPASGTVTR